MIRCRFIQQGFRWSVLAMLGALTCACSSTVDNFGDSVQDSIKTHVASISPLGGVVNVNYVTKDELNEDPRYDHAMSDAPHGRILGAVRFSKSNNENAEGQVFVLQRKSGAYIAETKIHEGKKTRYFFSFGVNYREKAPMVGLRVEF